MAGFGVGKWHSQTWVSRTSLWLLFAGWPSGPGDGVRDVAGYSTHSGGRLFNVDVLHEARRPAVVTLMTMMQSTRCSALRAVGAYNPVAVMMSSEIVAVGTSYWQGQRPGE